MVEHVSRMQYKIDVAGEDVGHRSREAVLGVDRTLIPSRFGIGLAVGGVTQVRVREVRNANGASRRVG
jgi:hypothetical protein